MDFTIVDAGVAGVALLSGLLAYARGLTREVFALFGWVVAGLLGLYAAPYVEPLVREAPVVGAFFEDSCVLSMIAAITVVLAFGLLILSVVTPLASTAVLESVLAPVDRALGFVFGVARGLVFVAVVYFIYANLAGEQAWPPLDDAASKRFLDEALVTAERELPTEVPDWFGERIDALMAPCGAGLEDPAPSTPGDGEAT